MAQSMTKRTLSLVLPPWWNLVHRLHKEPEKHQRKGGRMKQPLQLSFRNCEESEAVAQSIREHASRLD